VLRLPRCAPDPAAPCWAEAPALRRFAPGPRLLVGPAEGELRVAWDDDGLLVKIDALPTGARAEAALGPAAGRGRAPSDELARAAAARRGAPGVLRVGAPARGGERRALWINLDVPTPDGGRAALPWAPSGPGDPSRPIQAWLADGPPVDLPWELDRSAQGWTLLAPGATRVSLIHEAVEVPSASRGVPPPWQVDGVDRVVAAPPDTGWIRAEAEWRDAAGQLVLLRGARIWSEPGAPGGLPVAAPSGPPVFRLRPGDGLCAEGGLDGPADLLREELQRVLGEAPGDGRPCRLRLRRADGMAPESFRLRVGAGGAEVLAADLRGATYGVLALVDLLGPSGEAPKVDRVESPAISRRPLFHSLRVGHRDDLSPASWLRWVRRVVLRGRYNEVHLLLTDGFRSEVAPDLSRPRAWTAAELRGIDEALSALGVELVPGVNAPGHAGWITAARPWLQEDVQRELLDVRHPDTLGLIGALRDELWTAMGRPPAVHLGMDEAVWQSGRWFGDERNPRTEASPRAFLLADVLRPALAWCAEQGVEALVWSDLLLEGWNGARDGAHRLLDELSAAERGQLTVLAWSPLGDPLEALVRGRGMRVMRVHTGYLDWKREGLREALPLLTGEGLGLFQPVPWSAFGPAAGSRPLHYGIGAVLLAGATAWDPALVDARIGPSLAALAGHSAMRPGYRAIPSGVQRMLRPVGAEPGPELPSPAWPAELRSDRLVYAPAPRVARSGSPVQIVAGPARVAAVSVLQAILLPHDVENTLRDAQNGDSRAAVVAELRARWADGAEASAPLVYGTDTASLLADSRVNALWGAADVIPIGSALAVSTEPRARDLRLARTDWINPRPDVPVLSLELVAVPAGAAVIVGAATAVEAP
jgi:hypothetical protein